MFSTYNLIKKASHRSEMPFIIVHSSVDYAHAKVIGVVDVILRIVQFFSIVF